MKSPHVIATIALAVLVAGASVSDAGQSRSRPRGGSGSSSGQSAKASAPPARSGGASQRMATPRAAAPRAEARETRATAPSRGARGDEVAAANDRRGGSSSVAESSGRGVSNDRYARSRDGRVVTGRAIPRGTAGVRVRPIIVGSSYYWNRYYWYPYGVGAWGLGWYYYDPWWGYGPGGYGYGPGAYGYGPGYAYGYGYQGLDVGSVRLRIQPREAQVFVDGGYVGIVDEFDGTFQRLRLETGPHRIEVRLDGFEPLVFNVHITLGRTMTLSGVLEPI
jgi:hypothetical protein